MRYARTWQMTIGGKLLTSILDAEGRPGGRSLFGLSNQELTEALREFSLPSYRIRQLEEALYRQRVSGLYDLTPWPKELREQVSAAGFRIGLPRIAETFKSVDGTERYLIAGDDGQTVETVWMPEGDGGEEGDGSLGDAGPDSESGQRG